jgi:effector-binding domain-containing protein
MAEIRMVDAPEQDTAVVRDRVPLDGMAAFFARAFGATMHAMREQRVAPVGPPFGLYHGTPGETIDVEAGFPVSSPVTDVDDVVASSLPGGRVVEAVHVGPYDTLAETYREVEQWMVGQGLRPGAVTWESYLTDPAAQPDPSTWRTLVMWPVG